MKALPRRSMTQTVTVYDIVHNSGFYKPRKGWSEKILVISVLSENYAAGGSLDNCRNVPYLNHQQFGREGRSNRRMQIWWNGNSDFFFFITFTALLEISSSNLENSWQMDFVFRLLLLSMNVHFINMMRPSVSWFY